MSVIIGNATIAVTEHARGNLYCDAFKSRLDAVLKMIDNGGLAAALGGMGYGSSEHLAALVQVEQQIAATRARAAEMNARDAKNLPALDSEDPDLVYSLSGDDFSIGDFDELIETLRNDHEDDALVGLVYHVGVKQQQSASHYFDDQIDHVIDMARDRAHQECPEHTEDFCDDVTDAAKEELNNLIKAWADKYVDVRFWTAEHVEKKQITAEDL